MKIGVITELTGPGASGYTTVEKGIKAYTQKINDAGGINGNKIEYVMADTTSTPAGALTAAQKLVEKDHVFAVISIGSQFFGAEPYLLKAGVPVVGNGVDGPEWQDPKNTNLFDALGVTSPSNVYTTLGQYMKAGGATSCGSVGYSDSPSSVLAVKAFVKSCELAGLKAGYTTDVAFGSTDVGPIALGMKNSHTDGIYMPTVPNTAFALAGAIGQLGFKPKVFLLATGYGGDLLESKPAVQAAQGFKFSSFGQPVEMNTPATQAEMAALAKVGVTTTPTYAEQTSYLAMAALADGLRAAGPNPTQQGFMTAMRGIHDFDGDGLLEPTKIDFGNYSGPSQSCMYLVTLQGTKFIPDPKASPLCGTKAGTV